MAGSKERLDALHDIKLPWLPPVILFFSFICFLANSGKAGVDLLQDFGHQLYVPTKILQGLNLYSDIYWIYGPFSQYFNAGIFYLFGNSASILINSNIVWSLVLILLCYRIVEITSDRISGLLTGFSVLVLSCFSHLLEEGNFNFITPYSHEATHGTILLITLLLALFKWRSCGAIYAFIPGALGGCAFLSKPEPALVAILLLVFYCWVHRQSITRKPLLLCIAGFIAPLLIFFLVFLFRAGLSTALIALYGSWAPLFQSKASFFSSQIHLTTSGLDQPAHNLFQLLTFSIYCLVIVALTFALDFLASKIRIKTYYFSILGISFLTFLYLFGAKLHWLKMPLTFPLLLLISAFSYQTLQRKDLKDPKHFLYYATLLSAVIFSLRLGISPKLQHYGFFLELPTILIIVPTLTYTLPRLASKIYGGGSLLRTSAIVLVASFLAMYSRYSDFYFSARTEKIGDAQNYIYTLNPDHFAQAALARDLFYSLQNWPSKIESLAIVPNGAAINYLLKIPNPTALAWLGMDMFNFIGLNAILASYQSNSPQIIALVHPVEGDFIFGLPADNQNYARAMSSWIESNYNLAGVLQQGHTSSWIEIFELKK